MGHPPNQTQIFVRGLNILGGQQFLVVKSFWIKIFWVVKIGGWTESQACAETGAKTPIQAT